jgi:nicotine blue oxidoreductase
MSGWREHGAAPAAGLLLAAGAGRRYGRPKALVELDGRLLVESSLATLRAGGCEPIVVVLGAQAESVRQRADLTGATVVINPDWARGMGRSLGVGLAALATTGASMAVVLLVDTPGITPAAIRRVVPRGGPGALVVATYDGQPGHPVLLGREHWPGVARRAVGDVGARRYLREHPEQVLSVECRDIADGRDLDLPESPTVPQRRR